MARYFLIVLALLVAPVVQAFEAGAAKIEITPPLGAPLNGYGDRMGRGAVSVHDPVWARCLYLDDGATRVFLVNADLCVINRELRDRVLELAPKDVPRENIFLTATHTHSAQGGMVKGLIFRTVSGRFMPELLEATAQKIAGAMASAYAARQRASIGYGTTEQDSLSINRRQEGGPIDRQIGVISVEDADGNPIAIVTNFAAHPTTAPDSDHYAISADYPGYYYDELEKLCGGKCVAMFMNGAEGNQRCGNPENHEGWARAESIGRTLAARVKALANDVACADAKLHVGTSAPQLPLTLAKSFLPAKTVLKTLEINDLLLTFFPGEPCVEIGLELRQRALARGYAAQFSVALSNDHLMYFAPRGEYSKIEYESGMNFYGPRIEDWFYDEFSRLMTRAGHEEPNVGEAGESKVAEPQPTAGGSIIRLAGTPYEIGRQRGAAFKDALTSAYQSKIVAHIESGQYVPKTGGWSWLPSFVDPLPLALPQLGISVRPMLTGVGPNVTEEIEGMAAGAGLPFDAVWLLQCGAVIAARGKTEDLYRSPFCTMFAAVGGKAGADDLLIGRNLDWADDDQFGIRDVRPQKGHRFAEIGPVWSAGVFTGMNDAGLTLCAERMEALGEPSLDGPPVEIVLRQILQDTGDAKSAVAALQAAPHIRGYHVLAADPAGPSAQVLEFGATVKVRDMVNGLLLGADPAGFEVDLDAKARYARVAALFEKERIISAAEIQKALGDSDSTQTGRARIFNDATRYSVVFEPRARTVRVSFRDSSGQLGAYTPVVLAEKREVPAKEAEAKKPAARKPEPAKQPAVKKR